MSNANVNILTLNTRESQMKTLKVR